MTVEILLIVLIVVLAVGIAAFVALNTKLINQIKDGFNQIKDTDQSDDVIEKFASLMAKNEEAKTIIEEETSITKESPAVEEIEENSIDEENSVVLVRSAIVTYNDAYLGLSEEAKSYADEILAYARTKDEAKEIINDRAATVYLGKKQIVRVFIRKGLVCVKLIMPNTTLNAYADNNDLNIKEKPIDIKVTKPELVSSVKDIIDLVYDALVVNRNRREEEKKERRRQARLAKKAQQ